MSEKCFFCDIQKEKDNQKFLENDNFFSRFDDFPISKGHAEIIPKFHMASIFELSEEQIKDLFSLIKESKEFLKKEYNPDGFNIGINDGESAGQSIFHLHVHLIPRYKGDVKNPRGGVRNLFPEKADYTEDIKKIPSRADYVSDLPKVYNKLIRDKIPEIIEFNNQKAEIHIADEKEYEQKLNEKLSEEVKEYIESEEIDELADILEVIHGLCDSKNISFEELEKIREDKANKRGGFKKKLILESVTDLDK